MFQNWMGRTQTRGLHELGRTNSASSARVKPSCMQNSRRTIAPLGSEWITVQPDCHLANSILQTCWSETLHDEKELCESLELALTLYYIMLLRWNCTDMKKAITRLCLVWHYVGFELVSKMNLTTDAKGKSILPILSYLYLIAWLLLAVGFVVYNLGNFGEFRNRV